jgi:hypothetical protein
METRKLIIGVGAIMVVAALVAVSVTLGLLAAGGSDTGGEIVSASQANLANQADQQAAPDNSGARRPAGRVMESVIDDGNGPVASRIEILPSPDLPDRESETSGVFLRRVDNSVFLGTGAIELNVQIEQAADGSVVPSVSLSSNGPEVEVVITRDTVLYQDVTKIPGQGGVPGKAGDTTVIQKVKLIDTLDDLKGNAELQVWGTRRADRVVADILVFGIVDPNLGF